MSNLLSQYNVKKLQIAKEKKDRDTFLKVLNQNPPAKWIKTHSFLKNEERKPIEYIPIEIIENTLTMLFQEWNVEIKNIMPFFNSIAVTVRLHYKDPITGNMMYQDGVGASPAQIDKNTVFSVATIKSNAIQIGLPSAVSFAIKDAAEHIGKIFGRDIGRKDSVEFTPRYSDVQALAKNEETARVLESILQAKTIAELDEIEATLLNVGVYDLYREEINKKRPTLT